MPEGIRTRFPGAAASRAGPADPGHGMRIIRVSVTNGTVRRIHVGWIVD